MSEYKFYFDEDTVNYYAEGFKQTQFGNGWASTAFEIYKYIADECEWEDEADMRLLYLDLLEQVEDKINQ